MRVIVALLIAIALIGLPSGAPFGAACSALEHITTIRVGAGPREIAVDPGRQKIYVANSGATTISVIDAQTLTVIAEWPLTGPIRAMALDSTTSRIYVAYDIGDRRTELWAIDAESGQHLRGIWFLWEGVAVAINPSLQRVYMAGRWTSQNAISFERLSVMDGAIIQELYAQIGQGGLTHYSDVAVDEATGAIYAAHHSKYNEQSYIVGYDADGKRGVGGIRFDESTASPSTITIDSVRQRALLTMGGGVRIVDLGTEPRWQSGASYPPLSYRSVRLGVRGPLDVAVDDVTGIAYTVPSAGFGGGPPTLAAIDVLAARELVQASLAGGTRYRLAVDSVMHRVYVTNDDSGTVSAFRGFASPDVPAC